MTSKDAQQLTRLEAPIVSTVWQLLVEVGDVVEAGHQVAILESMKMEIPLEAPRRGVVAEIPAEIGQIVQEGDAVVVLAG